MTGCQPSHSKPKQAKLTQPNIIIIMTDDQGYADVSCYDHSKEVHTPHIDSIARAGVRFTNGYVSGIQCVPSRAGLLSGKYQQRYGLYSNKDIFDGGFRDQITLPQVLKKNGYATGMVGKWHLGRSVEKEKPYHRGFDKFYGFLQGMRGYLKYNAKRPLLRNGEPLKEKFGYLTDFFNREAVSYIDKHSSQGPFFLYVSYNAPHYPLEAKAEYLKKFNTGNPKRDAQLAMMASVDEGVGQIIASLKKNGVYDNTLLFFLSDHGGETNKGADNGVLRAGKNTLYEGGTRVPFLVSWPARVPSGKVSKSTVVSLDIFTTAVAAAKGDMPNDKIIDGKDLLPTILGQTNVPLHETLFWQQRENQWALRHKNWKLINNGESFELYDLEKDIGEQHNIAANHSTIVAQLETLYTHWKKEMK